MGFARALPKPVGGACAAAATAAGGAAAASAACCALHLYWGRAISLHSECTHGCLHMAAATAAILHGLNAD